MNVWTSISLCGICGDQRHCVEISQTLQVMLDAFGAIVGSNWQNCHNLIQ